MTPVRALISADVEGMTGVTCPADCTPGTPEFARFQPIFTAEVNAVGRGLLDGGVDEVLVTEAHGSMRNLLLEQLDPRIRMITGMHKTYSMMEGIQSRPDIVAFVGYHAAAGEPGVLSHTMIGPLLVHAELNGVLMSEGYVNAALAAEFGGRVSLVSGDDLTCVDAANYAPNAELVTVKQAVDRYTANCLHPEVTQKLLYEAGTRAVNAGPTTTATPPFICEMEFAVSSAAAACSLVPTVTRVDHRTVRMEFELASELYRCIKTVLRAATSTAQPVYG
jgi:D-amino peptidase